MTTAFINIGIPKHTNAMSGEVGTVEMIIFNSNREERTLTSNNAVTDTPFEVGETVLSQVVDQSPYSQNFRHYRLGFTVRAT